MLSVPWIITNPKPHQCHSKIILFYYVKILLFKKKYAYSMWNEAQIPDRLVLHFNYYIMLLTSVANNEQSMYYIFLKRVSSTQQRNAFAKSTITHKLTDY